MADDGNSPDRVKRPADHDVGECDVVPDRRDDEQPLLSVRNLRTTFRTDRERVHAVDGISFDIYPGETVGLVGESGSGKTVTARSLVGLVESAGRVHPESEIRYRGETVGPDGERSFDDVRGGEIAMVFQDALSALNPVYTVGDQIVEALRYQRGLTGEAATDRAVALLEAVGLPDARRRLDAYPHEISGGQRQRVLIAMALACEPDLLLCDEPTTALDVTTQAQILDLLVTLQAERDLSLLFITHDMGVIAQIVDRVNVMYAGEIIERAPVGALFETPMHPYTRGLLASVPSARRTAAIEPIEGDVPTPTERASHCRFAPRCPEAFGACHDTHPTHVPLADDATPADEPGPTTDRSGDHDRSVACLLYGEGGADR